ncbi:histidine--tRNA ligase [Buchnera aphidicola]|uniref:histidine--tRNA ligase n=1 Tax=Buchnera aphidicola TaxID=9 RepID=UPI00094D2951|nr:histidine--tRNA ligase [Buchnera aphidicola]
MNIPYRSIRGMHDLLPVDTCILSQIEEKIKNTLNNYAYFEIRFPIVEETGLFEKAIGNNTDIIHKEMYNFYDKKKKKISLRPEGTVSCIRACIQNNIFYNSPVQKFWYHGPMFRYERPQKGRFRQFHQLGVECFGLKSTIIDYEIILLTLKIWEQLKILPYLKLEINSIGSIQDRKNFSLDLQIFFKKHISQLSSHEKYLLSNNPIRILDSKNSNIIQLLKSAPILNSYLSLSANIRFNKLCRLLNQANINYVVNKQLVRGLDYYNDTVFEWTSDILGAQKALCAGGRYDSLIKYLGGKNNPAIGFAIGMDRLYILKKTVYQLDHRALFIDINILFLESVYAVLAINISEKLRLLWPHLKINTYLKTIKKNNYTKFSKQVKSKFLLILSSDTLNLNKIIVQDLISQKKTIISFNRIFQNPCMFKNQ